MNESIKSHNNSMIQKETSGKIESFLNILNKLNFGDKKEFTKEEIKKIFYKLIPSDNNLLSEKMISVLDIQNSISLDDLISSFIQFDDELNKNLSELENKLLVEHNNLNNYIEKCKKYKDEKLNAEGFCQNSKLNIKINNIDIKLNSDSYQIILEIKYGNEVDHKIINKKEDYSVCYFEFVPKNRNDNIIITIKEISNGEEIILGNKEFPLDKITSQEEYEVDIDVPDINDSNTVISSISAKILLYWSDYQFFSDKRDKTELKIKKIENIIYEIRKYLRDIDLIYKKQNIINDTNYDCIQMNNQLVSPSTIDTNKKNLKNFKNISNIVNFNDIYQETDISMGNCYYNKNNNLVNLSISFLILGLINGIFRSEFHNILGSLLFLLSCYKHYWMDSEKYINLFKFDFYFCMVLITYDVIWLLNNFGFESCYWCGTDNFSLKFIKLISLGIVGGSIILKSLCSTQLYTNMRNLLNEV